MKVISNKLKLFFYKFFNVCTNNFDKSIALNPKIKKIMTVGIKISFVLTLISTLILSLYITTNRSTSVYIIGSTLFKSFTTFIAFFVICGFSFNTISNQLRKF